MAHHARELALKLDIVAIITMSLSMDRPTQPGSQITSACPKPMETRHTTGTLQLTTALELISP